MFPMSSALRSNTLSPAIIGPQSWPPVTGRSRVGYTEFDSEGGMEFGLFTEFHPPPAPARRPALLVVDLQRELWDSALALGVQSRVAGHVGAPTALIPEAGGEVALAEVVEDRDESAPSDAL